MKFLRTKHWHTHGSIQNKIEFNEPLDIDRNQLSSRVDRCTYEESGWTINSIIQYQIVTMFLSCHLSVSEWMHTVYLPECQITPCEAGEKSEV